MNPDIFYHQNSQKASTWKHFRHFRCVSYAVQERIAVHRGDIVVGIHSDIAKPWAKQRVLPYYGRMCCFFLNGEFHPALSRLHELRRKTASDNLILRIFWIGNLFKKKRSSITGTSRHDTMRHHLYICYLIQTEVRLRPVEPVA